MYDPLDHELDRQRVEKAWEDLNRFYDNQARWLVAGYVPCGFCSNHYLWGESCEEAKELGWCDDCFEEHVLKVSSGCKDQEQEVPF